jgi:hypothetical protein
MTRDHYLFCMPCHAAKIIDGTKTTTIRAPRKDKRDPKVGDTIVLRKWIGKPYGSGSTVEDLRKVTVTSARRIRVNRQTRGVFIDDEKQLANVVEKMAVADGFCGTWAMVDYLTSDKQPEFTGFIYGWEG